MLKGKTMLTKKTKQRKPQGGCNRRVVNKGLSQQTLQALRDKSYRDELAAIEREYSIGGDSL